MAGAKRILVIEDTDDVRVLLIRQLARLGYEVLGAADGEEGLAVIAAEPLDLILCDLRMPKVDGLGVLTALREMKSGLPVIVMSGEGLLQDAVSALKLGAWDYLSKPIASMAALQHSVGMALERARLLAENQRQREKLELVYRELAEDQEAGRRLQAGLLPPQNTEIGSFTLTRELLPSSYLSGDFLSTFALPENRWGFYLADVAGHGVPSALVTVMLRTLIDRWVTEARDSRPFAPAHFLKELNRELLRQGHEKHVALFYGLVDETRCTLTCANAGAYPWPVLFQGGTTQILELPGMPLGLLPTASWEERVYELGDDAKFAACTDGVFEVLPGSTNDEKLARITEVAARSDTAGRLVEGLGLTRSQQRPDDVAVLMLRRRLSHALRTS